MKKGEKKRIFHNPYESLANAIIICAIDDYKRAIRRNDAVGISAAERFFKGSWYATLTTVEPDIIISAAWDQVGKGQMRRLGNITA